MASSSTASTPGGQVQRLGHRPTLTVWDAIAQSLSIGPIFSSAFVAFLIAGAAGGAAPLSTIGSLLIELIYIGLCLAAVSLLLQDPGKWWRWLFLLVAVVTPVLGIYGSVVPFPVWPQSLGIYFSLAVIALSLLWTLVNRFAFPTRLGKASELHPWEVEEVAPEAAPAS